MARRDLKTFQSQFLDINLHFGCGSNIGYSIKSLSNSNNRKWRNYRTADLLGRTYHIYVGIFQPNFQEMFFRSKTKFWAWFHLGSLLEYGRFITNYWNHINSRVPYPMTRNDPKTFQSDFLHINLDFKRGSSLGYIVKSWSNSNNRK